MLPGIPTIHQRDQLDGEGGNKIRSLSIPSLLLGEVIVAVVLVLHDPLAAHPIVGHSVQQGVGGSGGRGFVAKDNAETGCNLVDSFNIVGKV